VEEPVGGETFVQQEKKEGEETILTERKRRKKGSIEAATSGKRGGHTSIFLQSVSGRDHPIRHQRRKKKKKRIVPNYRRSQKEALGKKREKDFLFGEDQKDVQRYRWEKVSEIRPSEA